MKKEVKQSELDAKASIAADLFREGKVERKEVFRVEIDALLGENTGDLKFKNNDDYRLNEM